MKRWLFCSIEVSTINYVTESMPTESERHLAKIVRALDALVVKQNRQLIYEISQRENISIDQLESFLETFLTSKKCVISL